MKFVRKFGLAMAVSLALGVPALAQNAPLSSAVGQWVYSPQGEKIGSVRGLTADGQVEVLVGAYFQPGSHIETVPARAFSLADGRVTLQPQTLQSQTLQAALRR